MSVADVELREFRGRPRLHFGPHDELPQLARSAQLNGITYDAPIDTGRLIRIVDTKRAEKARFLYEENQYSLSLMARIFLKLLELRAAFQLPTGQMAEYTISVIAITLCAFSGICIVVVATLLVVNGNYFYLPPLALAFFGCVSLGMVKLAGHRRLHGALAGDDCEI